LLQKRNNTPKITIYIVNKNYSNYLEEAILSSLRQTYVNKEILIIDDNSNDNSYSILKKFKKYQNIRIFLRKKNFGLIKNSNYCIRKAKGKYVLRLDADDVLKKTALEKMYNFIKKKKLSFVYCDYEIINKTGKLLKKVKQISYEKRLIKNVAPLGACCLINKNTFQKHGLYDESIFKQDNYDLWYKFINKEKIGHLKQNLFSYRRHKKNSTNNLNDIYKNRSLILQKKLKFKNNYNLIFTKNTSYFENKIKDNKFFKKNFFKKNKRFQNIYCEVYKKKNNQTLLYIELAILELLIHKLNTIHVIYKKNSVFDFSKNKNERIVLLSLYRDKKKGRVSKFYV